MGGKVRSGLIPALLATIVTGCAGVREVRYVYQDGQYGVVGLPENTSRWPTYYREHAEELMARHFPEGFEVVRAEEVVEGSRTLTVGDTRAAELTAALPTPLARLGTLGRTTTSKRSDSVKIKECRIIYKKAGPDGHPKPGEFAETAAATPSLYVDPNAVARRHPDAPPPAPDTSEVARADHQTPDRPADNPPRADADRAKPSRRLEADPDPT